MINPFHLLLGGRSYLRAGIQTPVLIVGSLASCVAFAQTYPINGVWVAMDQPFPVSKAGACLTLKTFGVDALFNGAFPTVMIFSDGQRFVVRGGRPTERTLKSVKSTKKGDFQITELPGKHGGWLPWSKSRPFNLKVLDPMLIKITEGPISSRFFKCASAGRLL